jgi:hypothetical protein
LETKAGALAKIDAMLRDKHEAEDHGGQVTNDPAGHLAGAQIEDTLRRVSFVNRQTNLRTNDLDHVKRSHAALQIDREVLPML